jgi:hypothetical protein
MTKRERASRHEAFVIKLTTVLFNAMTEEGWLKARSEGGETLYGLTEKTLDMRSAGKKATTRATYESLPEPPYFECGCGCGATSHNN